ncbi:MAG: hypothetical protein LQ350_002422 [Teloschistes chrysophthalmus]|nr:MAG: hypothetical protein LQ350_002422 [Niorma chrysophthalma]
MEEMALCAIAAMKEEAIKDYDGSVRDFSFFDREHPENPVYWLMRSSPVAVSTNLRRSTVLWTLMVLTNQLMHIQYYRTMDFYVSRDQIPVFNGFLQNRNPRIHISKTATVDNDTLTARALSSNYSYTGILKNATSMILQPTTGLQLKDDPQYTLDFNFAGLPVSMFGVFESILELMLILGKTDAMAEQDRISVVYGRLQVSIYLMQSFPFAPGYHLRQYMAVSVLDAVARWYVARRVWKEMTVVLKVDGLELAKGCVTLAVRGKEWCRGMFGADINLPPAGIEAGTEDAVTMS